MSLLDFFDDDNDWRIGVAIGDQVLDLRLAHLIDGQEINQVMRCWWNRMP